jgi:methyl-accepting chemotaxis protein
VAIVVNGEKIGTTGIATKVEIAKPLVMVTSRILMARIIDEMRKATVNEVVQNVSENVRSTAEEIEKLSASFQEVSATAEGVAKMSAEAGHKVQDTGKIIDLSRSIASQIKLLSLNASIEAARAGQAGRGFSVVAAEMQKLSQSSSDATNHISQILSEIQETNKQAIAGINQLTTVLHGQSAGLQHIADMSGSVDKVAKDLVHLFANNEDK